MFCATWDAISGVLGVAAIDHSAVQGRQRGAIELETSGEVTRHAHQHTGQTGQGGYHDQGVVDGGGQVAGGCFCTHVLDIALPSHSVTHFAGRRGIMCAHGRGELPW